MWIIFFSVPIVVHIVAQRSAVGLKFDFLKENENKPWGGVKYSVQVAILPHILPWSAFLGPRCYYWCCCVCSQRPWGLGPQFCLETRSIMVRLFPGREGGGWLLDSGEKTSRCKPICMIPIGNSSTSSPRPLLPSNLLLCCIHFMGLEH